MEEIGALANPKRQGVRWFPPIGRFLRVGLALAVLSFVVATLDNASFRTSGVSLVWLSNGFLAGVLLCAPRRHWPAFILLGYAIDLSLNLQQGDPISTAAFLALCNLTEVVVAAALMAPAIAARADLTEVKQIRSLLLYGVLIAPTLASLMGTIYLHQVNGAPFQNAFRSWFAADVLGMATATPLYLSFHYGRRFSHRPNVEVVSLFLMLGVVSVGIFRLTTYPMLWVVLLSLLLLGVRLGFTGSAVGLLLVTFLGGYFTLQGYGPLSMNGTLADRVLVFQLFIALSMFALYLTEVARSSRRRALRRLEASENRFRSLTEASRDVIMFAELNGSLQYISPAVTELLGWDEEDLVGESYRRFTHVEDIPKFDLAIQNLLTGADTSPVSYRALRKNGGVLWLEASSRLMHASDPDKPTGIVSVLRDISDRKEAERQMQQAFQKVEQLAMIDGLTGIANRRLLDQTLHREWLSCMREQTPLSLLIIDVDHFKLYNDNYGHLTGDECLRTIVCEIQGTLRRSRDFLARYGGEEFVVLLPNTSEKNALVIADKLRTVIQECAIPHAESPHGVVTASLGCATIVPTAESSINCLLNAADAALYRAKSNGRNRQEIAAPVGNS